MYPARIWPQFSNNVFPSSPVISISSRPSFSLTERETAWEVVHFSLLSKTLRVTVSTFLSIAKWSKKSYRLSFVVSICWWVLCYCHIQLTLIAVQKRNLDPCSHFLTLGTSVLPSVKWDELNVSCRIFVKINNKICNLRLWLVACGRCLTAG